MRHSYLGLPNPGATFAVSIDAGEPRGGAPLDAPNDIYNRWQFRLLGHDARPESTRRTSSN